MKTGQTVMKPKSLLLKIKYELVIFAALLAQMAVGINWKQPVPVNYLTFYLLDFKVGFISRGLIGSFVDLLTNKATEKWLTGFILLTFAAVYFILALLLGKLIRSADAGMRNSLIFLTALALFTCFTGRVLLNNIGLMDIYWFLFALLAMVCVRNKYARWLVPLLCFMGLAAHYGFAMTFLPFIFVLLIVETVNGKYKISSIVPAVVSFLISVCSAVYFTIFANGSLNFDSDGTYKYLSAKADFPVWRYYVDAYLYYADANSGKKLGLSDYLAILREAASQSLSATHLISTLMLLLPMIILFFLVWKNAFKLGKNKAEKFIFLLCMALPLPVLPSFVFSTDAPRFLGEILIVQFMTLFYLAYVKNAALLASLKKAENFFRKYPMLLILLFILSLSAFFFK
jgi:hypothetical protein